MAYTFYVKLGSGADQLLGESRDKHHVGWIKVIRFGPEFDQSVSSASSERASTISFMRVIKSIDKLSPKIAQATSTGRHFNTVVCELADQATGLPKFRYDCHDATIIRVNALGREPPMEEFSFAFASWSVNQNPIPDDAAQLTLSVVARQLSHFIK
jgi:type VI protein secretion system component Hcp